MPKKQLSSLGYRKQAQIMNKNKQCQSPFLALLALMLCSFAIGTTEFVTTGLLPNLAHSFHVSIPTAAYVTSGYAFGVVIGAPCLTALTIHLPRKKVLIALIVLFIVGSVLSAVAFSFYFLMAGRILSALCHGAFFGIASVVATSLVAPEKKASAIALMFTGLTIANVVGVPLGTLLGHHLGWRSVFWVISALGVVGLLGIMALIPKQTANCDTNLRKELSVFKRPQVWLALAITAIGFGGLLASFAYIAPMMVDVAGYAPNSVAWLLCLYGIGLVIGNYIGGKAADWRLNTTIYISLALLAILLFSFVFTAHFKIPAAITLFLLGVVGFSVIPPLQMQVMQKAEGAATLASAANIAAFNLGVTLAVYLGGVSIHMGYGYTSVNWVGASLTTIGLVLAIVVNLPWIRRMAAHR